ncbi:MAG: cytochrome c oxidase assembly factor Coa1 family protein [Limisphaerales bacterium]
MKRKKLFIISIIVVLILIISYVTSYWFLSTSEPYKLAQKLIYESPLVKNQIGQITDLSLAFWGFKFRYTGLSGSAEFKIIVVGEKNKGVVFFTLERDTGEWRVISAKLKSEKGEFITIQ